MLVTATERWSRDQGKSARTPAENIRGLRLSAKGLMFKYQHQNSRHERVQAGEVTGVSMTGQSEEIAVRKAGRVRQEYASTTAGSKMLFVDDTSGSASCNVSGRG